MEMRTTVAGAGIRACCTSEENLYVIEQNDRVIVRRCVQCDRRHFRALIGEVVMKDGPARIRLVGGSMGEEQRNG